MMSQEDVVDDLDYENGRLKARIQELEGENKRISKLYEESQRGWKKALLEIEALKKGGAS